jgi:hypothetical protein
MNRFFNNKRIYEVFDEIKKASSEDEAIDILRKNESIELRAILRGTYCPTITFAIKEAPPYKTNRNSLPSLGMTTIRYELQSIYIFEENNPRVSPNLSLERKKVILVQILEYLEPREAEIFLGMILKKQDVPYLSYETVKKAFPTLMK